MNYAKHSYLLFLLTALPSVSQAVVDEPLEEQATEKSAKQAVKQTPEQSKFNISSNTFLEIEEFKGYKINDKKVFDKISPVVQVAIQPVDSKWSYFMEYKVSMRNHTTNFHSEKTSYNRNRLQLQVNRNLYKSQDANLNLSFVYRKESNDVKSGMPAKNSYHSYWLIPGGSYNFTEKFAFAFWDAAYYYDNAFSGPGYNDWEWESEHGFQYRINDKILAKLMYYTDWTWNSHGDKTWEQNQIRGYFPTTINEQWNIQPYFRYFLNEKNYDPLTGATTNRADNGGLRLGLIVNYNLTPKTTLWTNLAWEQTTWQHSKNSQQVHLTYGSDNTQDFRLYSIGIRHIW